MSIGMCPVCGGLFCTPPDNQFAGKPCNCGYQQTVNLSLASLQSQLSQREVQLDNNIQFAKDWEACAKRNQERLSVLEQKNAELKDTLKLWICAFNSSPNLKELKLSAAFDSTEKALSTTPSDAYVRKEELEKANHTILDRDEEIARIELLHLSSIQQARIEELESVIKLILIREHHGGISDWDDTNRNTINLVVSRLRQRLEQLKKDQGLVQ